MQGISAEALVEENSLTAQSRMLSRNRTGIKPG
jgi:hypothetical protein